MLKLNNLSKLSVTLGNREIITATSDVPVTSVSAQLVNVNRTVLAVMDTNMQAGSNVSADITIEPADTELMLKGTVILEITWDIGVGHFQNSRILLEPSL